MKNHLYKMSKHVRYNYQWIQSDLSTHPSYYYCLDLSLCYLPFLGQCLQQITPSCHNNLKLFVPLLAIIYTNKFTTLTQSKSKTHKIVTHGKRKIIWCQTSTANRKYFGFAIMWNIYNRAKKGDINMWGRASKRERENKMTYFCSVAVLLLSVYFLQMK